MKFAQLFPGQRIEAGPYRVTEEEIVRFAQRYDPQWFHTDAQRAACGRFGGLIASGWYTCAVAMRLATDAVLQDSESFASPGIDYIKWLHPVRPGDALQLLATVLEVRHSRTKPDIGILHWRWQLANAESHDVLDLQATSLFDLVAAGSSAPRGPLAG